MIYDKSNQISVFGLTLIYYDAGRATSTNRKRHWLHWAKKDIFPVFLLRTIEFPLCSCDKFPWVMRKISWTLLLNVLCVFFNWKSVFCHFRRKSFLSSHRDFLSLHKQERFFSFSWNVQMHLPFNLLSEHLHFYLIWHRIASHQESEYNLIYYLSQWKTSTRRTARNHANACVLLKNLFLWLCISIHLMHVPSFNAVDFGSWLQKIRIKCSKWIFYFLFVHARTVFRRPNKEISLPRCSNIDIYAFCRRR